jgi:hypothetical protein
VLRTAYHLIAILGLTGNRYDAERFARISYEALTRPHLNPESYEAANAAINLVNASYDLMKTNGPESADIEEAGMSARDAIRIMESHKMPYGNDNGFEILISILFMKKDFTNETKSLLENYLTDSVRNQGVDGRNTSCS